MVIVTKLDDDSTQATSRPHIEGDRRSLAPPSYEALTPFTPASHGGGTVQMMQRATRPVLIQDYYENLPAVRAASPTSWSPLSSMSTLPLPRSAHPTIRKGTSARRKRRLAVLLAGTVLLSATVLLALVRHRGWSREIWRIVRGLPKALATHPQQADGRIVEQFGSLGSNWTQQYPTNTSWTNSSRITLDLPLRDPHGYYFVLRGSSYGEIQVSEGTPGDKIRVEIAVDYDERDSLFELASAYLLERHANETGVGLFLPMAGSTINSRVSIIIPRSDEGRTRLQSLRIDAGQLRARFMLGDGVTIGDLTLVADTVHSATAFRTSSSNVLAQSEIRGQYSASRLMRMETSSSRGVLRAETFLGGGAPAGFQPTLELHSPGYVRHEPWTVHCCRVADWLLSLVRFIGGSVALLDADRFRVHLGDQQSSATEVYYAVESLPINSTLEFEACTTAGNMELRVPPTYHGSLDLCKTEHETSPVRVAQGLRDPTGAGMEHVLSTDWSSDGRWRGSVGWGSSDRRGGSVRLASQARQPHHHCRLTIS